MKNNIFEKNIKAMDKWYPEFGEEIRKKKEEIGNSEKEREIQIVNELSLDGQQIVKVIKETRAVYLYGKRNAGEPIDIWRERIGELHKYTPVYLVGLGNGGYLKKILEKADETITVIAYEPSIELFLNLLNTVDISKEIKSRPIGFIIEGMNEAALDSVLRKIITYETMAYLKVETHPNYSTLFPEEVKKALKCAQKITDFLLVNINSGRKFSTVLAKNQIENAKYALEGYNTRTLFEAIPHDQPAILVSAGPSLNKNIQMLKKAKGRAFILAVDTAVKPLLKAGIEPDAFITMDALKPIKLFDDERINSIPVVAPLLSNSAFMNMHRGKKIFYFDNYKLGFFLYMEVGKIMPPVEPGGSVACPGLSMLYKFGFSQIILVGQDFAFTDNRTHADGTFQDKMPEIDMTGKVKVKGNYEETVWTDPSFTLFIDWFDEYIAGMKEHSTVRVINATEGGAYIQGTELMTLEEAIAQNCKDETVDYRALIENMKPDFSEEEKQKIICYLKSIPDKFDAIIACADKLRKEYETIFQMGKKHKVDKQKYLKSLKKIKKYTKECDQLEMYDMIENSIPLAEYILRTESLMDMASIEDEAKQIGEQGMKYCELVKDCAEIIKEFAQEQYSGL